MTAQVQAADADRPLQVRRLKGLHFTVASRLFEELGDRLVSSPAMALAELVKNGYDADAARVQIELQPEGRDEIHVGDDGHGMTAPEFESYWLRVGDDHKKELGASPYLGRPFTGSKGVGRIASELLSRELILETTSIKSPRNKFRIHLDWKEAITTGDLVDVEVDAKEEEYESDQPIGTRLILRGLRHEWTVDEVDNLAHELWRLEPPFQKRRISGQTRPLSSVPRGELSDSDLHKFRAPTDFGIRFRAADEAVTDSFEETRLRLFNLHEARIVGNIEEGKPRMSVQFADGEEFYHDSFPELEGVGKALVEDARFEIRVFHLKGRQKGNIKVNDVRQYLREYGGVQIFDSGFRLSHYGSRENDWLLITEDHARRLSESPILPPELQIPLGMHYMPTYYQVYGAVEIQTNVEPNLDISITRDRLLPSPAFQKLRDVVRVSLHWYGMLRMARESSSAKPEPKPRQSVASVSRVIEDHKADLPKPTYMAMKKAAKTAEQSVAKGEQETGRHLATLSAYATAGIASMAYHHEIDKQLFELERIADDLEGIHGGKQDKRVLALRDRIHEWTNHARQLKAIFAPLATLDNRVEESRYSLAGIVADVRKQLSLPLRPVTFEMDIHGDIRLPTATYMEWASILQNLVFNAINALDAVENPRICVTGHVENGYARLRVMDNGSGVDLDKASSFFDPFTREGHIDPVKTMRGFGGAGMGLSIVRMIGERRGCRVRFEPPKEPFKTSFVMDWEAD